MTDLVKQFLHVYGEEKVGFGKYTDKGYKDVPESYFIWIYENQKQNGTNNKAYEYGRILKGRN